MSVKYFNLTTTDYLFWTNIFSSPGENPLNTHTHHRRSPYQIVSLRLCRAPAVALPIIHNGNAGRFRFRTNDAVARDTHRRHDVVIRSELFNEYRSENTHVCGPCCRCTTDRSTHMAFAPRSKISNVLVRTGVEEHTTLGPAPVPQKLKCPSRLWQYPNMNTHTHTRYDADHTRLRILFKRQLT